MQQYSARSPIGLSSWLHAAAQEQGDREVLIGVENGRRTKVTLGQLESKSLSLATGLRSIGAGEGSTIAIWLPNQIELMVTQFACTAIGASVLGLNTRYRSYEISHLLGTVPLHAIVLPSQFLGIDFVGTMKESVENRRNIDPSFRAPDLIFLDEIPREAAEIGARCYRFGDLASAEELVDRRDHSAALSNLFTTSGSTSAPKVAGHDQASIVRHALADAHALDVRAGDRFLAILPICGVFGFNSVMAMFFGGGAVVLMRSFDVEEAARHLRESGITHVIGGDEMLDALFTKVPDGVDLPLLRRGCITNFVGRVKSVVEQAEMRWSVSISSVYGSSEIFALAAMWPQDADQPVRCLQGGVVVECGVEVRVVDLDTRLEVESGVSGELEFSGYNVIERYLNNPKATADAFTPDGWFRSGDLGYMANGGFVFQCRAREALRLRGFLVEPGEIEEFLSLDEAVDEVHVVGVDTPTGTKAIAFARPRPGRSIDEPALLAQAKQNLAGFKVPLRVIEVSEFPTTAGTNGPKVRFEELRETARELLGEKPEGPQSDTDNTST
ncbi:MAG TPA: AMP-binding protein [Acidimicrobiales bacterium]|nr:AMP-binding protein [Acidimicrobiales bacterium]